ncbi:MAG: hypothetical protein WAW31_00310 [Smithella sp.]
MNTDELPSVIRKVLKYRRQSRVDFMLSKVVVASNMKVIDIGCGVDGRSFDDYVPMDWEIIGADIQPAERVHHKHPRFSYIRQVDPKLSQEDLEFVRETQEKIWRFWRQNNDL